MFEYDQLRRLTEAYLFTLLVLKNAARAKIFDGL